MMSSAHAFVLQATDNVATLIDDAAAGAAVTCRGGLPEPRTLTAGEPIARGHKIALGAIAPGAAVMKFGVRIGHATAAIAPGTWVHLHNLASDLDERSATLDRDSGAPTDTISAYV